MQISKERLSQEANNSGFRPEMLEKVFHLIALLKGCTNHPFLKTRFALKGGTALNLFLFNLPRLSIDIDLNYLGELNKEKMLSERPLIEEAITAICQREGYSIKTLSPEHAGSKWIISYPSSISQSANIAIDFNYLLRSPLWPITEANTKISSFISAESVPVLDVHELAAGKLVALFARCSGRDLFDTYQLISNINFDLDKLKLAFLIYGAINRKDWRTVKVVDAQISTKQLQQDLAPLLSSHLSKNKTFFEQMYIGSQNLLTELLNFSPQQQEFLSNLLDKGEIVPTLITSDETLGNIIASHPALLWKAINVKQFKKK